ncbi:GIY-YIG nuclease family protein [Patescibacteria group bacterium]|nr:GIY-YIG nuclease family protein [Patescibacteria group bacterium]
MYSVYVIYNKICDKFYIGQTENLEKRLQLHNSRHFKNSYTSRFNGEWKLIHIENFNSRKEAVKREKQLKSYQGRLYIKKLIRP